MNVTATELHTIEEPTKQIVLTSYPLNEVLSITRNDKPLSTGIAGNNNTTFEAGYDVLVDFPNHALMFPVDLASGDVVNVKCVKEDVWASDDLHIRFLLKKAGEYEARIEALEALCKVGNA